MTRRDLFRAMLRAVGAFAAALLGLDSHCVLTRRGLAVAMRETHGEAAERERAIRLAA